MQVLPIATNSNVSGTPSAYIYVGQCLSVLRSMPSNSIDLCVTSPPYFGNLRDYGHPDQYGQEPSIEAYLANQVAVFSEVRRVLKPSGNLWINIGDKYDNGNLLGVPWKLAFALQADGWILREDVIWSKTNPVPESVRNRTTRSHEYLFHFTKSRDNYFDVEAIMVRGKPQSLPKSPSKATAQQLTTNGGDLRAGNYAKKLLENIAAGQEYLVRKRSVWDIAVAAHDSRRFGHNAMYPEALIEPIIASSCPMGGCVFDPYGGSGTSVAVANRLGRNGRMSELNPEFAKISKSRIESLGSKVVVVTSLGTESKKEVIQQVAA